MNQISLSGMVGLMLLSSSTFAMTTPSMFGFKVGVDTYFDVVKKIKRDTQAPLSNGYGKPHESIEIGPYYNRAKKTIVYKQEDIESYVAFFTKDSHKLYQMRIRWGNPATNQQTFVRLKTTLEQKYTNCNFVETDEYGQPPKRISKKDEYKENDFIPDAIDDDYPEPENTDVFGILSCKTEGVDIQLKGTAYVTLEYTDRALTQIRRDTFKKKVKQREKEELSMLDNL